MQVILVEVIAAIAGSVAATSLATKWFRLIKVDKKESITVTRQDTQKTVVLPQEYSPNAVRALAELVA